MKLELPKLGEFYQDQNVMFENVRNAPIPLLNDKETKKQTKNPPRQYIR